MNNLVYKKKLKNCFSAESSHFGFILIGNLFKIKHFPKRLKESIRVAKFRMQTYIYIFSKILSKRFFALRICLGMLDALP